LWQDREKINIEKFFKRLPFQIGNNRCLITLNTGRLWKARKRDAFESELNTEDPSDTLQYKELQAKIAAILERFLNDAERSSA